MIADERGYGEGTHGHHGSSACIVGHLRFRRIAGAIAAVSLLIGCAGGPAPQPTPNHGALGTPSAEPALAEMPDAREVAQASASAEPRRIDVVREAWRFAGVDGQLINTHNYRIHTTVAHEQFLERLPLFMELALDHYTSSLGALPRPHDVMDTYLFRDRRQWQVMTQRLLPDQARSFAGLGRGGFTTRGISVLYYIDYSRAMRARDTYAIAAHEGWHQYTQHAFRHQLPVWLEEGVATYMESFSIGHDGSPQFRPWANRERRDALAGAVRDGRLIPLPEVLQRSPHAFLNEGSERLLTYYAQVWALTRFVAEGEGGRYRPALEQVLLDAAEGRLVGRLASSTRITSQHRRSVAATSRSGPWVVLEYFNPDFAEFEEQYHRFIETLVQRGRR
jgi:hypothetical protein